MIQINCVLSVPALVRDTPPAYQFSVMNCTSTEPTSTIALIQNANTGAEFFLDKKINYGDVLILVFLLLFAVFGIAKIIADFFIPRRVSKF